MRAWILCEADQKGQTLHFVVGCCWFANTQRLSEQQDNSQWQTYDDYSRPTITTYPGSSVDVCGYQVKNIYDALGFLREVRDARATGSLYGNDVPAGYLYWKADGYALTGAINASTLGNGATLDRVISDITGRTFAITSGKGQAAEIQNVLYNFDAIGNVLRRQNSSTSSDEVFHYDGLNRLIDSNVNGASLINVTYDSLGSIQTKTNAGTYAYGENGFGPHAVTTLSGGPLGTRSFYYDANGNLTTETVGGISQRTQTWTSYNQMKTTTKNGRSTEFWFGANHERVLQQDNNGTKTVYIGSAMEIVTKGGLIERKTYIFTPAGRVAIRTERNDATPVETRFLHQDALGSVTAVTDEFGNVEQRFAFDAWGLRSQPVTTRTRTGGAITRGYTDHEQLDDYGLIHMNGRVYDPTLSRFLSTDAFVQDPLDNQTFNRYSYVQNNPTGRTDPTGWFTFHLDNEDGTKNYYFSSEEERADFLESLGDKGLVLVDANIAPFGKENAGKDKGTATGSKGSESVTTKTETSKALPGATPVIPSAGGAGGPTPPQPVKEDGPGQDKNTVAPNSGDSVSLGSGAQTPTSGTDGWGNVVVIYDGKETNPNGNGAKLRRTANNTVGWAMGDSGYAINAQSTAQAGGTLAIMEVPLGSLDYIVILDHGESNWYGGMRQTLGNDLIKPSQLGWLSPYLKPGGAIVMYGCSAGDSGRYMQIMANAAGNRVYAFNFDVKVDARWPLPSPDSSWTYRDPKKN